MKKTALLILPAAALLTGCETLQVQSRSTRTAQTQDQLIAQENQRRMAGRVETLEMEIDRISRDLDTLRMQLNDRLASIEQKSEQDKREMIARLSGELDKLIKQTAAASAAAAPQSSGSAYGYEHVVQPGETLSAIAKAYNVTSQAIINANKIKNPNVLSVGQKLFIPE